MAEAEQRIGAPCWSREPLAATACAAWRSPRRARGTTGAPASEAELVETLRRRRPSSTAAPRPPAPAVRRRAGRDDPGAARRRAASASPSSTSPTGSRTRASRACSRSPSPPTTSGPGASTSTSRIGGRNAAGDRSASTSSSARRGDPTRARRARRRRVISIPHPDALNHNGGQLAVRARRHALARDRRRRRRRRSVRERPRPREPARQAAADRPAARRPTGAPATGSHAATRSSAGPARDEICSYGLRNPWRFSFDSAARRRSRSATSARAREEEVDDRRPSPARGARTSAGPSSRATFDYPESPAVRRRPASRCPDLHLSEPAASGCAVTGGYVVRDPALPSARRPLPLRRLLRRRRSQLRPRPGRQRAPTGRGARHRPDPEPRSIRVGTGRTALRRLAVRRAIPIGARAGMSSIARPATTA